MSDTNNTHAKTRDQLRAALIGSTPAAERKLIKLFGNQVELVQPPLSEVLVDRGNISNADRLALMVVDYVVIPGTEERVFEDTDITMIKRWPFSRDVKELQDAIIELTGLDITTEVEDMKANPLDVPSQAGQ